MRFIESTLILSQTYSTQLSYYLLSSSLLLIFQQYIKSHTNKTIKYLGCPQFFLVHLVIILHLETRTYVLAIDKDWVKEIVLNCHNYILYTYHDDTKFDFKCPIYRTPFKYISALLQYTKSRSYRVYISKNTPLRNFMCFLIEQYSKDQLYQYTQQTRIVNRRIPIQRYIDMTFSCLSKYRPTR